MIFFNEFPKTSLIFSHFVVSYMNTRKGSDEMTFNELEKKLSAAGIENSSLEATLLLSHFCSLTPSSLPYSKGIDFVSEELTDAVNKRLGGYPLQYILGVWSFFGLDFKVNESCLIPRPDTEILVEETIKRLREKRIENARIADICTGSGCVAISLLSHLPQASAIATDIFDQTLTLARENAESNKVSERFFAFISDATADELDKTDRPTDFLPPYNAIVSNPPYIETEEIEALSAEVKREPRAALDGGEDGLDFYRAIVKNYRKYLTPDGFFAFEIGYNQAAALAKIAEENNMKCDVKKDYGGRDRVAVLYND